MKSNSCLSASADQVMLCYPDARLRRSFGAYIPQTRTSPGWFMATEVFISDFICAVRLRRAPDHHSVWKSSIIFTAARVLFIKRTRISCMWIRAGEKLHVEDVRCLLKCPGSRSVALVGRGNDRGTKEFMCKRCCFFFFYILAEVTVFTVCLERFDTHQRLWQAVSDVSVFVQGGPESVSDSTGKGKQGF